MQCKNCGSQIEENYLFCSKCGLKVGENVDNNKNNKSSKFLITIALFMLVIPIVLGFLHFKYNLLPNKIFYYISLGCFIGILIVVLLNKFMFDNNKSIKNILGVTIISICIIVYIIHILFLVIVFLLAKGR